MSGILVCATNQARFFISKNPEQALNFELFSGKALIFKVSLQNGILFWQSGLERQKFQLLSRKDDRSNPNFLSKSMPVF